MDRVACERTSVAQCGLAGARGKGGIGDIQGFQADPAVAAFEVVANAAPGQLCRWPALAGAISLTGDSQGI